MFGQLRHRGHVPLDGPRRIVPHLQVLDQSLCERRPQLLLSRHKPRQEKLQRIRLPGKRKTSAPSQRRGLDLFTSKMTTAERFCSTS
jgi:hypothetical protein